MIVGVVICWHVLAAHGNPATPLTHDTGDWFGTANEYSFAWWCLVLSEAFDRKLCRLQFFTCRSDIMILWAAPFGVRCTPNRSGGNPCQATQPSWVGGCFFSLRQLYNTSHLVNSYIYYTTNCHLCVCDLPAQRHLCDRNPGDRERFLMGCFRFLRKRWSFTVSKVCSASSLW